MVWMVKANKREDVSFISRNIYGLLADLLHFYQNSLSRLSQQSSAILHVFCLEGKGLLFWSTTKYQCSGDGSGSCEKNANPASGLNKLVFHLRK